MRTFSGIVLAALLICPPAFGQSTFALPISTSGAIQTGFVVITPTSGMGAGLTVSEIFAEQSGDSLFQSTVLATPPVTSTAVVVNAGAAGLDTGISIVNVNGVSANVVITLRDQLGFTVAVRTIALGPRQQVSRFVTELFAGEPALLTSFVGQVFIDSTVSIGVLGLQFNGPSFTSLPVVGQLPTRLSTASLTFTTNVPNTNPQLVTSPLVPPTPTKLGTSTSAVPITPNIVGISTGPPGTSVFISSTPTNVGIVAPPAVFPLVAPGVGGEAAQLLPQFVTGGGWASQVTLANTSLSDKTVRVDFFNSEGGPLLLPFGSSQTDVFIPAGGVAVLSSQF